MKNIILGLCLVGFFFGLPDKDPVSEAIVQVGRIIVETENGFENRGSCFPIKVTPVESKLEIYIVTAKHVITKFKKIRAEFFAYKIKERYGLGIVPTFVLNDLKLVGEREDLDIAVFKGYTIEGEKISIKALKLQKSSPRMGQEVLAVGCPLGMPPVITKGIVSRKSEFPKGPRWICSAPIAPGNSGGVLLNINTGEVVGISLSVRSMRTGFTAQLITYLHMFASSEDISNFLSACADIGKKRAKI